METVIAGQIVGRAFSPDSVAKFERTKMYYDQSLNWLFATRGLVPIEVVDSWELIHWPNNQLRTGRISVKKMEVAAAYNKLFEMVTNEDAAEARFGDYAKTMMRAHFILTTEEDNIIPSDAIQRMLTAIYTCIDCGEDVGGSEWKCPNGHKGLDAVSGLYWMKVEPPQPMAFGDPKDPNDFKHRSVKQALADKAVIEVNAIAMGCAIWRKELFRKVSQPWFETSDAWTQDMYFCKKAKAETGARFAVDCGIKVGHLNLDNGEVI